MRRLLCYYSQNIKQLIGDGLLMDHWVVGGWVIGEDCRDSPTPSTLSIYQYIISKIGYKGVVVVGIVT